MADAVVITFLVPSVASYGCYLFLKEPFPRSAQYASLISLLGVVMIARPTSFFTSTASTDTTVSTPSNTTSASMGSSFPVPTSGQRMSAVLVAMIGVLGSAGACKSTFPLYLYIHYLATLESASVRPLKASSPPHYLLIPKSK